MFILYGCSQLHIIAKTLLDFCYFSGLWQNTLEISACDTAIDTTVAATDLPLDFSQQNTSQFLLTGDLKTRFHKCFLSILYEIISMIINVNLFP